MDNIISPYKNVEQFTRIIIEPHQMNSDIRNHMKFNLKKKVEKKCNKIGYIDEVYKIIKYSDGIMIPENLSGNAIYNISYHCRLCMPIEDSIIIGQIKIINQELIVAINGPIMIFIPRDNVDLNNWNIIDNFIHIKNNIKLNIGNFVSIQILNKRINQHDTQIKTIGKLINFVTDEEVEKKFDNKININNDDSNFI